MDYLNTFLFCTACDYISSAFSMLFSVLTFLKFCFIIYQIVLNHSLVYTGIGEIKDFTCRNDILNVAQKNVIT